MRFETVLCLQDLCENSTTASTLTKARDCRARCHGRPDPFSYVGSESGWSPFVLFIDLSLGADL